MKCLSCCSPYSMFQIDVTTSHRDCTGEESLARSLIIKADPNIPIALKLQGKHFYTDSTCFYGEEINVHSLLLALIWRPSLVAPLLKCCIIKVGGFYRPKILNEKHGIGGIMFILKYLTNEHFRKCPIAGNLARVSQWHSLWEVVTSIWNILYTDLAMNPLLTIKYHLHKMPLCRHQYVYRATVWHILMP